MSIIVHPCEILGLLSLVPLRPSQPVHLELVQLELHIYGSKVQLLVAVKMSCKNSQDFLFYCMQIIINDNTAMHQLDSQYGDALVFTLW